VEIMLQLKYHRIVKEFIDIYEIIVSEVIGIALDKVCYPAGILVFFNSI
jgi:hypothetical protein